jgi:signal transduction histidine kinase/CheY-like chemotaxis protein
MNRVEHSSLVTEGLRNERAQAYVRLGICAFMAAYFAAIGFSNHPLYLWFIAYCLGYLALLGRSSGFSPVRTHIAMVLDNFFTIGGLHVTGTQGVFLYIFLIHITFGYGVRYGRRYLWCSVTLACAGVTSMYLLAPAWQGDLHAFIAFFAGVPFIALYIDYFVTRLRRSRLESDARADELRKLLAFVAHDVRTPLQAVLSTLELVDGMTLPFAARKRLTRVRHTIEMLGRMSSRILQLSDATLEARAATEEVVLYRWLAGVINIFRDDIMHSNAVAKWNFDLRISPLIVLDRHAAERLLLNAFSNAVRFVEGGSLTIATDNIVTSGSKRLRITVRNFGGAKAVAGGEKRLFHGSGLGLMASRDLALSSGGSFQLESSDTGAEHLCTIEMPFSEASNSMPLATSLPVVTIGLDDGVLARVRSSLDGIAHVIAFDHIDGGLRGALPAQHEVAAIFVGFAEVSRMHLTASDRGVLRGIGPFAAVVRQSMSSDLVDVRPLLCLDENLPAVCWINALQVLAGAREADEIDAAHAPLGPSIGRKGLLIDDNAINAEVLHEGLATMRLEMVHARSLAEARRELRTGQFAIVISDWHVGGETAGSLVNEWARDGARLGNWVILSAARRETIVEELPAGVDCQVLERPITLDALRIAVLAAINGGRLRSVEARERRVAFDFGLYEEMLDAGTDGDRLVALLNGVQSEMECALHDLADSMRSDLDCRRALHAIKSIGESAGALALGQTASALLRDCDADGRVQRPDPLQEILLAWELALRQIIFYRYYLVELIRRSTN